MIDSGRQVDLVLYKSFMEQNNAKMNRILSKFIWFSVGIGPALALGIFFKAFVFMNYDVCILTSGLLILVAFINSVLVKCGKNNMITSLIIMSSLEIIICIMYLSGIDIFMGFFVVPLVSLLYCNRRIYEITSGLCLFAMVVCNWNMAEHYASRRIDMGRKTWFWSMTTGFVIEYIIMFAIGFILCKVIIEHVERLCSDHVNIASSKKRMLINEAFNRALEEKGPEAALKKITALLGELFDADRVLIFEDTGGQGLFINTYEWTAENVPAMINSGVRAWKTDINDFFDRLAVGNVVFFDNVETLKSKELELYNGMKARKVECMVSSLICGGGRRYGFFSIENPKNYDVMELKEYCGQISTQILSLLKVRDNFLENENQTMVNSMSSVTSIYAGVYLVDLNTDAVTIIKKSKILDVWTQNSRGLGFSKNVKLLIEGKVSEKYKELTTEFMDLGTLPERLKGKGTIYVEVEGKEFGWARLRYIKVEDGKEEAADNSKVLFCMEIIDEEKNRENKLIYLSETDLMTGLRNRGSGESKIEESIANPTPGLFCIIDVDDFKSINDNCGHAVGDRALIAIADSLKRAFREQDVIMRLGGDEFAVYAEGIESEEQANRPINRLFNLVENRVIPELKSKGIKMSVSMGAAIKSPKESITFDEIYKKADDCMYMSKRKKGCWVTFSQK